MAPERLLDRRLGDTGVSARFPGFLFSRKSRRWRRSLHYWSLPRFARFLAVRTVLAYPTGCATPACRGWFCAPRNWRRVRPGLKLGGAEAERSNCSAIRTEAPTTGRGFQSFWPLSLAHRERHSPCGHRSKGYTTQTS